MRVPRRFILGPDSAFHLIWRGHNRERVLEGHREKRAYLRFIASSFRARPNSNVRLFSYCLMSNHPHFTGRIEAGAASVLCLSRLFQAANSCFGRWYNKLHRRSGKVAEERFKTLRIEDDRHLQTVMFYGDANPVRGGIVKHPRDYSWSSYRFYAFGDRSAGSDVLTPPGWYVALGRTSALRQRAYRRSMDAYLRSAGLLRDQTMTGGWFIGAPGFVRSQHAELRNKLSALRRYLAFSRAP